MPPADFSRSTTVSSRVALMIGAALLCTPGGIAPGNLHAQTLWTAGICALLALSLHHLIRLTLKPPASYRWVLVPVLALPPAFGLMGLPAPVAVTTYLFALATLWSAFGSALGSAPGIDSDKARPPLAYAFPVLALAGWGLLSRQAALPSFEPPSLPSATRVWIGLALLLPLGVATQSRLRNAARRILLMELALAFLFLTLPPVGWTLASGFKERGEPERSFHILTPRSGFRVAESMDPEEFLPESFRGFEHPRRMLTALNSMNLRLRHDALARAFPDDPKGALRQLQLYGFLQRDRHGYYVPPHSYHNPEPPAHATDAILEPVRRLAEHAAYPASDLARELRIPEPEARAILLRLRNLNLTDTLPGPGHRFRLTPQARAPLENGLLPRQILFLHPVTGPPPEGRVFRKDYAPEWNLSYDRSIAERFALLQAGALEVAPGPAWQTDGAFLGDPGVWIPVAWTVLATFGGLWIACRLPAMGGWMPAGCGLAVLALGLAVPSAPAPVLMFSALAAGGWCLRNAVPLPRDLRNRILLFAAAMGVARVLPQLTPPDTGLALQAAWNTLWFPVALVLLGGALR